MARTGFKRDKYLQVLRCSAHDVWCINIGDEDTGHRVTPMKCCGSWDVCVKEFPLSQSTCQQLMDQIKPLLTEFKRRAKGGSDGK